MEIEFYYVLELRKYNYILNTLNESGLQNLKNIHHNWLYFPIT